MEKASIFRDVLGQERALEFLSSSLNSPLNAYLFVGPAGVGKRTTARKFAAALLCADSGCEECNVCDRVLRNIHPDFHVVERSGANISLDQARNVVQEASRAPMESDRKVILLTEFHLVEEAAPALLKTVEEASPSTVFVFHAEYLPAELQTIASRSALVGFSPLSEEVVRQILLNNGVDETNASLFAQVSHGNAHRASDLAHNLGAMERLELWHSVPNRLDATGNATVTLVNEILASIDLATSVLEDELAIERKAALEEAKSMGEKAGAVKSIEDEHKRQVRRARTDLFRFGLLVLGYEYRDRLLRNEGDEQLNLAALDAIQEANAALIRNPNEQLLLDALFTQLCRRQPTKS